MFVLVEISDIVLNCRVLRLYGGSQSLHLELKRMVNEAVGMHTAWSNI